MRFPIALAAASLASALAFAQSPDALAEPARPVSPGVRLGELLPWLAVGLLALALGLVAWANWQRSKANGRAGDVTADEALCRATLEGVSDAVLLARADGTLAFVSAGARQVFLRDPVEVQRARVDDLLGPDLDERVRAAGPDGVANAECRQVVGEDGRPRTLLVSVSPVRIRDAVRLYVCRDVTERVRLERQVRQRRALESIGLIAGGVAHDFNNLLQVIGGYAQMAGSERATADARRTYLSQVEAATERATGLTRQLLAIARRKPEEKAAVDVGRVTADLLPLLGGLLGPRVIVNFDRPADPLTVLGDPTQVEQVVLNLLVNARDAMPDGGTATVEWGTVDRTAEQVAAHPNVAAGRFVRLRVADTGTGIPPAVRSKIFEPFFTTKGDAEGTGLGLSVVLGVAQDAGGFVSVQSEEGVGSAFEVYWPQPPDPLPEGTP